MAKNSIVNIFIDTTEKARWDARAKALGMTLSDYVLYVVRLEGRIGVHVAERQTQQRQFTRQHDERVLQRCLTALKRELINELNALFREHVGTDLDALSHQRAAVTSKPNSCYSHVEYRS